jgi:hypothetical protein
MAEACRQNYIYIHIYKYMYILDIPTRILSLDKGQSSLPVLYGSNKTFIIFLHTSFGEAALRKCEAETLKLEKYLATQSIPEEGIM